MLSSGWKGAEKHVATTPGQDPSQRHTVCFVAAVSNLARVKGSCNACQLFPLLLICFSLVGATNVQRLENQFCMNKATNVAWHQVLQEAHCTNRQYILPKPACWSCWRNPAEATRSTRSRQMRLRPFGGLPMQMLWLMCLFHGAPPRRQATSCIASPRVQYHVQGWVLCLPHALQPVHASFVMRHQKWENALFFQALPGEWKARNWSPLLCFSTAIMVTRGRPMGMNSKYLAAGR